MFKCGFNQCQFNSTNKREVLFHTLVAHANQHNFRTKCCFEKCSVAFKTYQKYFTHVETANHDGISQNYNNLECDVPNCFTLMSSLDGLKKHYYTHLEDLNFNLPLDCIFKNCSSNYKCQKKNATKTHFSNQHRNGMIEDLREIFFNTQIFNNDQIENETAVESYCDIDSIDYSLSDISFKGIFMSFLLIF